MSKLINQVKSDIYIGKAAGTIIVDEIMAAKKSVKVISPYLSPFLVSVLVEKKAKGIDVQLITSDDIEDYKERENKNIYKIIQQKEHVDEAKSKLKMYYLIATMSLALFAFIAAFMLLNNYEDYTLKKFLTVLVIFLGLVSVARMFFKWYKELIPLTYSYKLFFPVRVYKSYLKNIKKATNRSKDTFLTIHTKMYIIDDEVAYLGSSNFTSSGTTFNHESRIKLTDKVAIEKLNDEFEDLMTNTFYQCLEMDEWGRELYELELK